MRVALITMLLISLPLYLAIGGFVVVGATTSTTSLPTISEIQGNGYVVNQSGVFIKVPAFKKLNLSYASIRIDYNDSGIFIKIVSFDPNGVTGEIDIYDPNMTKITTIDVDVAGGDIANYNITLPSSENYTYIVMNATLNGYALGLFAVPKQIKPVVDINKIASVSKQVAFIIALVPVAPFLGVALRGKPRESGLALFALGVFYIPILHAFGLSTPIPEFIGAMAIIIGILLMAVEQT